MGGLHVGKGGQNISMVERGGNVYMARVSTS